MSQASGYCSKCGAPLQAGSQYCNKCGAPVASQAQPTSWREQRRQEREQRRGQRSGVGALVVATILIVAGLGIYFPSLPWQAFWGGLLILAGLWIVFLWVRRGRSAPVGARLSQ